MKTIVYVDGFNLYYGTVRNTSHKWLDLGKLFRFLLPGDEVLKIRYFTALIRPTADDPRRPQRQQISLRALATLPNLTVHYGRFLTHPKRLPRHPLANPPEMVDVLKTEEKGADVNLASYLLTDCFDSACEQSVVVLADGDLALPIEIARERFGNRVGVLIPWRHDSAKLREVADYHRVIREGAVRVCQFPNSLTDAIGRFHRPPEW